MTASATTGNYDHPMVPMFENEEGRAAMAWPIIARIGTMFAKQMVKGVIVEELMTCNNQKEGAFTKKQAQAVAEEKIKDPRMDAFGVESLPVHLTMGPLYPESYDTILVDLNNYKVNIPFD